MGTQLKIASEKIIIFGSLALIASLFGWLFYSNFYFTQSFDHLLIYDVDDLLFHRTLQKMADLFSERKLVEMFAVADHGYGNIFWSPLFFLTRVSEWLGSSRWTIALPRQVSLFSFLLVLTAFYKISRLRQFSKDTALLGLLLICSSGGMVLSAIRFHNHMTIAALVLWSFYFLLKPRKQSQTPVYIGCVLFGLAVGVKVIALVFWPPFFFLVNQNFSMNKQWWKRNFLYSLLVFIVALIAFSPALLMAPLGSQAFVQSFYPLRYMVFVRPFLPFPQPIGIFQNIRENFFPFFYHGSLYFIGIMFALYLLIVRRKDTFDRKLIPILALLAFAITLLITQLTTKDTYSLRFYPVPVVLIFTFIFLEMRSAISSYVGSVLLVLIVSLNVYLNYTYWTDQMLRAYIANKREDVQHAFKMYEIYKTAVPFKKEDRLIIENETLFPLGLMANHKNIIIAFNNEIANFDRDVYIFSKKTPHWKNSCEDLLNERFFDLKICQKMKSIMFAAKPNVQIYDDEDIRVVRRK